MYISDAHLKTFLSDGGLVSQKNFDIADKEAKETGRSVGEVLVGKSLIGEDELRRTYAYILGIPFLSLVGTQIPFTTLQLIPEPVARRNNIIAYAHKGGELEVAMLDTDDLDFLRDDEWGEPDLVGPDAVRRRPWGPAHDPGDVGCSDAGATFKKPLLTVKGVGHRLIRARRVVEDVTVEGVGHGVLRACRASSSMSAC